jgi:hypothetical protein
MRYRHFLRVDANSLPKESFERICALAPEGRKNYGFHLQIDSTSPDGGDVVKQIAEICNSHGLERRRVIGANCFGHSADRWYGEERNNAEFFVLGRQDKIQGLTRPERDEQGRLLLIASNAKPSKKLGRIFPNWIIVSEKVRRLLESESFVGPQFGEVVLQGKSINASPDPFWELKSSIVLPKMANVHQFIHPGMTEPEPFRGDYSITIMLDDPPFNKGEVHYRRSDLAKLGQFDIGRTFEKYMEPHEALVVSQRFYQHCLKHKIPLEVEPVRIDLD